MNETESLYLDCARFLAAVCVVGNHFIHNDILPPPLAAFLPDFGREAVMLFFVLSGYVIAWTTETKHATLKSYLVARAARIYSVALPVLLLALAVDSVAIQFNAERYTHLYQYDRFYLYVPLHLAFLGEVWTLAERPFTIPPYWSLSYEVWYYVLFATLFFYRGRKRLVLALAVAAVIGYQHWILLPVWMSGVLLYRNQHRLPLGTAVARCGVLASAGALVAIKLTGLDVALWQLGRDVWPFESLPQGSADQFLGDYVTCVLVVVNFHCARHADLRFLLPLATPVRTLASYTFTLYLVHTLVIYTWIRNFSYDQHSAGEFVAMIAMIAFVTWLVGQLTEKRRNAFKEWFGALADAGESRLSGHRIARWLAPNRDEVLGNSH